jgi:hypothetical protein
MHGCLRIRNSGKHSSRTRLRPPESFKSKPRRRDSSPLITLTLTSSLTWSMTYIRNRSIGDPSMVCPSALCHPMILKRSPKKGHSTVSRFVYNQPSGSPLEKKRTQGPQARKVGLEFCQSIFSKSVIHSDFIRAELGRMTIVP